MSKKSGTLNKNRARVETIIAGKVHIFEQRDDGVHCRVRYARDGHRLITFEELLSKPEKQKEQSDSHVKLNGKTVEVDLTTDEGRQELADELLCAAEDLKAVVRELTGAKLDPPTLYSVTTPMHKDSGKQGVVEWKLDAGHIRDTTEQVRKAFRLLRSVTCP